MYGLVLEGGGAKGSYHIGAYKALIEKNIKVSAITGTSIGALNGAMLCQGDFERVYDLWYNISNSQIFDVDDEMLGQIRKYELNQSNIAYLFRKSKQIIRNKGLDTKTIRSIIANNIDEEKIRKSEIDFGIVTVSLTDMKPLEIFIDEIPEGKLNDYVMASANFPAFKIEKLDGKVFIDGGVYDNFPVKLMLSKGYKNIIAVRTFGIGRQRKVEVEDIDIIYINPTEDLGSTLDFNLETARKNLLLGYYDTLKVLDNLRGNKYYINIKGNEELFHNILMNLSKEKCENIGILMGFEGIPHKRMLFEFIIPRIVELMNISKEKDYEDICIELCEIIAMELEMNRFQVYQVNDFLKEIINKYKESDLNLKNKIPNFIRKNSILSKTVKEQILKTILGILMEDKN
ncbi:patatin-like phospholipase family protein [Clostridium grantii]|uniref:NTE family protein n=1 Tax=Clostridium grantii DSM 8605 TaxID=1121316 RepID=A0A1M5WK70_9CLOT|nr:patatin-like phospholipase family protein [Clostridium grantii]SHH87871.1 NTE family protein [Clostridium grantii DSM 8605]